VSRKDLDAIIEVVARRSGGDSDKLIKEFVKEFDEQMASANKERQLRLLGELVIFGNAKV